MTRRYYCPQCSVLLNPRSMVVLLVEVEGKRDLILLSPEPRNYAVNHRDTLELVPGTAYPFSCPVCHADLTSPADDRFVEIRSISDEGVTVRVHFSRIFGERATFLVSDEGEERYGEDAGAYESVNFFGEGMLTREG